MVLKFKKDAEIVSSSETGYDLIHGGYIRPEDLLCDPKQAQEVRKALDLVIAFLDQAEEAGLVEVL